MNKIFILFVLSFTVPGFLVYGQSNNEDLKTVNVSNEPISSNIFEYIVSQYDIGVKFKDVLPVAIGILLFSYFIWKTSYFLSRREVFRQKITYTASGAPPSLNKNRIFYVVKYILIFPIIMYGWVVVCFFFMWTLNTSLNFDILTLIMVGIISASRIAAHWNEKLAEDIMKFLPFNLLFTLLLNPNLDFDKIVDAIHNFPPVMLELTIFIAFLGVLEAILKLIYFTVRKIRHSSDKGNLPIEPT
ncbi:MAG: hypothetical protein AABZ36_02665 [Nitrospirota bacterium]